MREVAARYGVHAYQLSTWRSESATKKTSATTAETIRFAAVRSLPADGDGVIEIDISSSCILARGEVSASMLREVVELIR